MTRTSHKKNRPFDFKLISLVQPHPVLYHRHWGGLSTFECMKEKNRIWNAIASEMGTSSDFCLSRWNNLRNHFQRELRHCHELCPKEGTIRGSTWPYLESMRFLERIVRFNKPIKGLCYNKRERKRLDSKILEASEETISGSSSYNNYPYNEAYIEYEELTNSSFGKRECAALQNEDEIIHERMLNYEQMAKLFNKIPSDLKVHVERRIMTYLCKCQLRAIASEGIADIGI
uniref:Transcription factor Adf-1 n=1 Tax=Zeugodacus cucurbitae TaxID=28588 RepID=A0A0A1XLW6_ZEUCU